MANIGRVYKDSYKKEGKELPLLILDMRTISTRKKFTIAVNKIKYTDGIVNKNIAQGKEEHADYHLWYNMSNRGESLPSVVVGSLRNEISDNGLAYKRGNIFDPFISKENIYFTLFSVDADKKIDENHLYDVIAQPYRKIQNNDYNNAQAAQPSYAEQGNQTYAKQDNSQIPTVYVDIDDEEIPF